MATYGIDVYGKTLYGAPQDLDYHVTNLTAVQSDYGRITLSWDTPPLADWTQLTLVRSGYGYPVAITDGVQLASFPVSTLRSDYADTDLPPGYWYYTFFLATPFPAWSAALTYGTGDRVAHGGSVWSCLVPYTLNVTPGTDSTVWSVSFETTLYRAAGSVACLSVRDYGYTALLESLVPAPYKALPGTSTDVSDPNADLTAFLSILGFGFAQMHTELDDLLEVDAILTTRQDRLYELGQGLGINPELASSARYQRLRTQRAARLNQEKGTAAGLADSVHAATGLKATVATGVNEVLTQDQSAFYSPPPTPWNPAGAYKPGDEVIYLGVRYTCVSSVSTVNTGNYVADAVTGAPNALSVVTVSSVSYVKETNAAGPTTVVSVPFTVLGNGSVTAVLVLGTGADSGILTAAIDGAAVQVGKLNLLRGQTQPTTYQASYDLYKASNGSVTLGTTPVALIAGAHTLTLSVASKNASASAYDLLFSTITFNENPLIYAPGNPPTGASTSAAQWSSSQAYTDSVTYLNPVTGGMGTWSAVGVSTTLATGYLGA